MENLQASDAPMLTSVSHLVDGLGGKTVLARDLGVVPSVISGWITKGIAGSDYWPAMVTLAERRGVPGVTLESLAKLNETDSARALAERVATIPLSSPRPQGRPRKTPIEQRPAT